jgi:hypothetical protein
MSGLWSDENEGGKWQWKAIPVRIYAFRSAVTTNRQQLEGITQQRFGQVVTATRSHGAAKIRPGDIKYIRFYLGRGLLYFSDQLFGGDNRVALA